NTNGIDFRWTPLGLKAATAACLDYSVFVPEKFPFNEGGGVLPAVIGGSPPPANSEKPDRFSVRLEWTEDAKGVLSVAPAGLDFRAVNLTGFPLEPGHWMRVQQEVVLNTPGAADGIVRLWADGDLAAEDTGIELRKNKDDGIIGVLADIGYVRQPPAAPGSLQFSPFEISWR
ncbi:MAG: polysaccharide lyase, partial [Hyphomicrobium sp.]